MPTQTNRKVKGAHQMLMQMIGKLGKDWKKGACLELHKIGCHWVQPALPDVWMMTMPAH